MGNASQVWTKPLGKGAIAVLFLSTGTATQDISVALTDIVPGLAASQVTQVRDLYQKKVVPISSVVSGGDLVVKSVPTHDSVMFKVTHR